MRNLYLIETIYHLNSFLVSSHAGFLRETNC
jgi:hypothetical protein